MNNGKKYTVPGEIGYYRINQFFNLKPTEISARKPGYLVANGNLFIGSNARETSITLNATGITVCCKIKIK